MELQRQIGLKPQELVFIMYHKIVVVIELLHNFYKLEDMVEYDEAFVEK